NVLQHCRPLMPTGSENSGWSLWNGNQPARIKENRVLRTLICAYITGNTTGQVSGSCVRFRESSGRRARSTYRKVDPVPLVTAREDRKEDRAMNLWGS